MGLSPIYTAILESRRIFKRIQSYVVYRLATTVQMVLVLFTLSVYFNLRVPAFLVVLLALFCDITVMPISADRAVPSPAPSTLAENMILLSTVLGVALFLQTILWYYYMNFSYYRDQNLRVSLPVGMQDFADPKECSVKFLAFLGEMVPRRNLGRHWTVAEGILQMETAYTSNFRSLVSC